MAESTLYPRYIRPLFLEALKDSPVTLIHGPRQCGKTTLARMVGGKKYKYITFDNDVAAEAAKIDPIGFVNSLPDRVILDEAQKAPKIFSSVKRAVDRRREPGRFILTGSANILRMSKLSDSLAGRMRILRLRPLAQGELTGKKSRFLDRLFKGKFKNRVKGKEAKISFSRLADQIVMGGYPAAIARPSGRRQSNWYRDYVEILTQKDASDLARIRSIDILPRLLSLTAAQTSQLVNFSNLASAFQISRPTICDYVALLEQMFFLERLPPWHSSRSRRFVKTPKLHLGDSGLACSLLGVSPLSLKEDRPLFGQIFETFVFQELRKQASFHKQHHDFFHYRDKKGHEVDIVIERDQLAAGLEVKLSSTVSSSDFKGLRKFGKTAGKRFAGGAILYNGDICASFGDKLFAVPLSFLWL